MNLPFFYADNIPGKDTAILLGEETSRHIVQVLRMKAGEKIRLTDGRGNAYTAEIIKEHKKSTEVNILDAKVQAPAKVTSTIAISLVKNNSRFEWFLEKATELGIGTIVPLICERTEKQHFRYDRMKNILVSAMLQSQQSWLPVLSEPVLFKPFVTKEFSGVSMIAHCLDGNKNDMLSALSAQTNALILIGPEGDFTSTEIEQALEAGYLPVSLGNTRLRTETAGVAAAVIMKLTTTV